MAKELKISPAIIIPVGLGLALTVGGFSLIALYKHGVEFYLFETPKQVRIDETFIVALGIVNKSDIVREGFIEEAVDGLMHDFRHLRLAPGESWELTFETGFSFDEKGVHELSYCIDTFNPDLVGYPWFLRPALSVSRQIEVV